ncbi:SRPBCC domain-containing protein [Devosia rhodophyticola]|uniref:SRPBCC domain-containing protein n=1 Tax=Devosia rhodophyticola TaxID=3026423 RepID=A0ABY7YVX8_9HYPH|nr:SRPBCC domain-containing protein [Devosia rhodophyticola]WDR05401.1 SRPBCC domain-containing protein [Devosia rhodophyticola]
MTPTALSMTRVIRAPRESVFKAWTDPEILVKWWGPGPVTCPEAEIDLRPGGAYRIANRQPDGSITWISGVFQSITPPEQLVYTWSVSMVPGDPTLVTLDFRPHPEGTELVLNHSRFADTAIRDMHLEGWGGCIDKLEALLAA